jgi:transposase InsO family protein
MRQVSSITDPEPIGHIAMRHRPLSQRLQPIRYGRGKFYYLYLIEDIYSRKAVGWEVYEAESGEKAAALLQRSVTHEKCWRQPLVLHSDNGAPMKSVTLLTKMYDLGITPSRSRPRVSNDNPYSESLFRTLKYCPRGRRMGLPAWMMRVLGQEFYDLLQHRAPS